MANYIVFSYIVFLITYIVFGLPDPIMDQTLHLVCKGIRRQQSTSERKRLPITIEILKVLKSHLRLSNYILCEQRMLWSSFTLSFYGFLCASECLSLTWSDITMDNNNLVIELHQSKTDPFRRRTIYTYLSHQFIYLPSMCSETLC